MAVFVKRAVTLFFLINLYIKASLWHFWFCEVCTTALVSVRAAVTCMSSIDAISSQSSVCLQFIWITTHSNLSQRSRAKSIFFWCNQTRMFIPLPFPPPPPRFTNKNMPTLKIQSNPGAIRKATAELCLSEIKGVISVFFKMFFCCCWNIHLSFFSITLSSPLSRSLNSEVKYVFFSYQITQRYYSFPHTPLGAEAP